MLPMTVASVSFTGGAVVGFDAPSHIVDRICTTMPYAGARKTQATPTVRYSQQVATQETPKRFVRADPKRPRANGPIGESFADLIDDLHLTIALHAESLVFIHAGLVSWGGVGIMIPGRSHSGKSTLVDALVRAGATYYSDEYACVQASGFAAPYARPIHLRTKTGRYLVDASTIGTVASTPVEVGLVVFTAHRSRASFEPIQVSPAVAALNLFDNTVVAQVEPERATQAAARIARRAHAVRTNRPEAEAVVKSVLDLAERQVAETQNDEGQQIGHRRAL